MKHIEAKASELLSRLGINNAPVKPSYIADKLGIKYSFTDLGDNISGVLVVQKKQAKIGISQSDGEVRKNFTFAHEIAHYCLHYKEDPLKEDKLFIDDVKLMFRKSTATRKEMMQEREANAFAAALLMPSKLIEREYNRIMKSNNNINEDDLIDALAVKFEVSSIAMTYRLINLGYINYRF